MTEKQKWTDEKVEAALKAYGSTIKDLNPLVEAAVQSADQRSKTRNQRVLCVAGLVMFALFVAVMLAGCGGDGSTGGGLEGLRPAGQPTAVPATSHVKVEATLPAQIIEVTRIVEATRVVEVTQPAQVTEVMKIVEVMVTATPEINGFDMSRPEINEEPQPCPARFWRNGRCVATQAQIDQAARESK